MTYSRVTTVVGTGMEKRHCGVTVHIRKPLLPAFLQDSFIGPWLFHRWLILAIAWGYCIFRLGTQRWYLQRIYVVLLSISVSNQDTLVPHHVMSSSLHVNSGFDSLLCFFFISTPALLSSSHIFRSIPQLP